MPQWHGLCVITCARAASVYGLFVSLSVRIFSQCDTLPSQAHHCTAFGGLVGLAFCGMFPAKTHGSLMQTSRARWRPLARSKLRRRLRPDHNHAAAVRMDTETDAVTWEEHQGNYPYAQRDAFISGLHRLETKLDDQAAEAERSSSPPDDQRSARLGFRDEAFQRHPLRTSKPRSPRCRRSRPKRGRRSPRRRRSGLERDPGSV